MINIVLHEPEIPANTGNIGRSCVAAGARLHLIEPLGFRLGEKEIKRAGLDYWDKLDVTVYKNYEEFLAKNPNAKIYMATTKAKHVYSEVCYEPDCYIMFGKESAGIPEEILVDHEETCVRIPMIGDIRSLNLSNSVAIVLYDTSSAVCLLGQPPPCIPSSAHLQAPAFPRRRVCGRTYIFYAPTRGGALSNRAFRRVCFRPSASAYISLCNRARLCRIP